MATRLRTLWARLRDWFRPDPPDREFNEELATHLALSEADKVARGMSTDQARRAARVELGGVSQLREATRAARGLPWLDAGWLDIRLGARMLMKHRGLTLTGGLAMTVVISIAAGAFSFLDTLLGSRLPLEEGDRVVALMTWDTEVGRRRNPSRRDFDRWRDTLGSVVDVGAFRAVERSVDAGDGPQRMTVAEITASAFALTRVAPLLGRPLLEEDERPGASPVVVVGHDVWRSRFSSDPAVVGRQVALDGMPHTVIGVMPPGYAFPVSHQLWAPLRARGSDVAADDSTVFAFGRLAAGVTQDAAQAELATLGLLPPVVPAELRRRWQTRVVPYTLGLVTTGESDERLLAGFVLLIVTLLLVPPCANIAILIYARTVTRQEEFAARHALGASRGRIVAQLFTEVLVLACGASAVALVIIRLAGEYLSRIIIIGTGVPFWMDFGVVSFRTVVFAGALAVLAAALSGLLPAWRATGRLAHAGLRAMASRTSLQLGATWTMLIVAQVALSIAVLPTAVELAWGTLRPGVLGPGFDADEFVAARLLMDPAPTLDGGASAPARFAALQTELRRRLDADSAVSGVAISASVPGQEPWAEIEIDGVAGLLAPGDGPFDDSTIGVDVNRVDDAFFDLFDLPVLAGQAFGPDDFVTGRNVVVINRTFARQISGDDVPVGHRLRYLRTPAGPVPGPAPWHEIVGVVDDLPANTFRRRVYHPMVPGEVNPVTLSIGVAPAQSAALGTRLFQMAPAVDASLRVGDFGRLDEVFRAWRRGNEIPAYLLVVVAMSVLALSAAGMHALMAFTVASRRREIGIRAALGAQPARLLAGVFRRALFQIGAGAAVGVLMASLLSSALPIEEMGGWSVPGVVPAAAVLMVIIGVLAALGPARRGLRLEPTEALRD